MRSLLHLTVFLIVGGLCPLAQAQAQELSALYDSAQQSEVKWLELAGALDGKLARMLPCDTRVTQSIEEVRTASTQRLADLNRYMSALSDAAAADAQHMTELSNQIEGLLDVSVEEAADTEQERSAVDEMVTMLTASAQRQRSLGPALEALKKIQQSVAVRSDLATEETDTASTLRTAIATLGQIYQQRETALADERRALEAERAQWTTYYTTRLSRAQLECTITGQ